MELASADLRRGAEAGEPVELTWLRQLLPSAKDARLGLRTPPCGEGWLGPLESSGHNWQMTLWYRWTSSTVINTVSRLCLPGNVSEAVSIFREADLVHNWLPFVTGGEAVWSDTMPAMLCRMRAKLPILPRSITTLVHRAFLDTSTDAENQGILLVEWTPKAEEISEGEFCGMVIPPAPPRTSQMQVQLATTLIECGGQGRCVITMHGENDFKVHRRLVPDMVLRKFLTMNSRVLGQRICACLEDLPGKGYAARISRDAQGFYGLMRSRLGDSERRGRR